jgi:hypothetical protein
MELTSEELRRLLHYDPETGVFRWKCQPCNRVKIGQEAGTGSNGYSLIRISGKCFKAHRLAWLYMTGEWPKEFIDHINGVRSDNRFANLREATQAENKRNIGKLRNNTSGFKGVYFNKLFNRWQARVMAAGKSIYLGSFMTPEEAHTAYCDGARRYHEEFAHF